MTNQMRQSLPYLRPSSVSIYLTTDKPDNMNKIRRILQIGEEVLNVYR